MEGPEIITCCCCIPVRCGFITLAILSILGTLGTLVQTFQLMSMGGFDLVPFFCVAMIGLCIAQTASGYLQVKYIMEDTMATRFDYLMAVHIQIGATLLFWAFLMFFVTKVLAVFQGAANNMSDIIANHTQNAFDQGVNFAGNQGMNVDIAFDAAAAQAGTVLRVTISVFFIISLCFQAYFRSVLVKYAPQGPEKSV